jgi:hypothetical protein
VFFELGGVVGLALFATWLFCLFDVITADEALVRNLPKGVWILLVVFLFDIGGILWLVAGRPRQVRAEGLPYKGNNGRIIAAPRRRLDGPIAPDDDPDFLASLDRSHLSEWERDLRRREEELRRRERGDDEGEPA